MIYDVIIVGCGGIGSTTFYEATQRGMHVLCLEQFSPGHPYGSTHGETRAFRVGYYDSPQFLPLLRDAHAQWKQLNCTARKTLFCENGILEIAEPSSHFMQTAVENSKRYNINVHILTPTDIHSRCPNLIVPNHMMGILQPEGGFLYIKECIRYFTQKALEQRGVLLSQETVLSWEMNPNKIIRVITSKNSYQARHLIITAGAWTPFILPTLNLPVVTLQKTSLWFLNKSKSHNLNISPCFSYHLNEGLFYGFPSINDYIKIGRHTGGFPLPSPSYRNTREANEEIEAIHHFAKHFLVDVSLSQTKQAYCFIRQLSRQNIHRRSISK